MRLVLATYNVHGCVGRDTRFDPTRTLGVLRELDADVIALQELQWDPGEARHLLAEFGERLGYSALAGPTLMRSDGHYGNALLTRLAVRGLDRVDLSLPGREPRGALDASLDAGGTALRVVATHLGLRPSERRAQMRSLLSLIGERRAAPLVMMGEVLMPVDPPALVVRPDSAVVAPIAPAIVVVPDVSSVSACAPSTDDCSVIAPPPLEVSVVAA